jgi:hypothetical protein
MAKKSVSLSVGRAKYNRETGSSLKAPATNPKTDSAKTAKKGK